MELGVGKEGVTNYIHMLGAGHFSHYLRKWRNLYRYSQQGWESLNSLIKSYYFHRTQRGGNGSRFDADDERSTRTKALGDWMQRRLFWLSDLWQPFFEPGTEE